MAAGTGVAQAGGLGVVSGTALDIVVARRLQDGDPDGSVRRALDHIPDSAMAERVRDRYFRPGGRPVEESAQVRPATSTTRTELTGRPKSPNANQLGGSRLNQPRHRTHALPAGLCAGACWLSGGAPVRVWR